MKIDFEKLQAPIDIKDIDFRVQSINSGGYATILAYKDARVDINRLNEVCTPLGWKREHTKDNHNCIVSLWDEENKQWVSKEDTGTESNTEAQKGLASDSFKRACFNFGIGIELYDYPVISVKLFDNEFESSNGKQKQTWNLKLKEWKWSSKFDGKKIIELTAIDNNGKKRFDWKDGSKATPPQSQIPAPVRDEKMFAACSEAKTSTTEANLKTVWEKYPQYQKDNTFITAVNMRKSELTKK